MILIRHSAADADCADYFIPDLERNAAGENDDPASISRVNAEGRIIRLTDSADSTTGETAAVSAANPKRFHFFFPLSCLASCFSLGAIP
jgi:hypothetical protein